MITLREAANGLLDAVVAAIESGDWKIDGACDPTVEIIRLKNALSQPVDAVNMSQECVDETAKRGHEPVYMGGVARDFPFDWKSNPRGDEMKPVAWIKIRELSYMKAVAEHGKDDWQTNLGLKPEPDDEGLYTETQVQRMIELLERCENEMRYAGWTKFESDNPARNDVYEQVKEFLK